MHAARRLLFQPYVYVPVITVVQSAASAGGNTVSLSGVSSSNSLVVLDSNNGPGSGQSMSGGGGTWTLKSTADTGGSVADIFVSPTTTGGSVTVTGSTGAYGSFGSITLLEVANLGVVDDIPSGTGGSGTTVTGPTVTPTVAGELIVAIASIAGAQTAPGTAPSGWTLLPNYGSSYVYASAAYIISGSAVTPIWAQLNSSLWAAVACSFKPA